MLQMPTSATSVLRTMTRVEHKVNSKTCAETRKSQIANRKSPGGLQDEKEEITQVKPLLQHLI